MKIRTDFVTNSSSESGIEIVIDNPVLLEILARYTVMGLFMVEEGYLFEVISIGSYFDSKDEYVQFKPDPNLHSLTPALHFVSGTWGYIETLEDCLSELIRVLGEESISHMDEELFDQLEEEVEQRNDEIKKAFNAVYWGYWESNYGSACPNHDGIASRVWRFYYDKINGESLDYEQDGEDEDFDNDW